MRFKITDNLNDGLAEAPPFEVEVPEVPEGDDAIDAVLSVLAAQLVEHPRAPRVGWSLSIERVA